MRWICQTCRSSFNQAVIDGNSALMSYHLIYCMFGHFVIEPTAQFAPGNGSLWYMALELPETDINGKRLLDVCQTHTNYVCCLYFNDLPELVEHLRLFHRLSARGRGWSGP